MVGTTLRWPRPPLIAVPGFSFCAKCWRQLELLPTTALAPASPSIPCDVNRHRAESQVHQAAITFLAAMLRFSATTHSDLCDSKRPLLCGQPNSMRALASEPMTAPLSLLGAESKKFQERFARDQPTFADFDGAEFSCRNQDVKRCPADADQMRGRFDTKC